MHEAHANAGTNRRLARLEDLDDYKLADGEPDIRGWDVLAVEGQRIGEVHGLIADTMAMAVRYLDIELDRNALGLHEDRHVLLPIGRAVLDDDADRVFLEGLTTEEVAGLPAYRHAPLTEEDELALRRQFDPGFAGRQRDGADIYEHPHYDQRRFFGHRRVGREDTDYITRSAEDTSIGKRTRAGGAVEASKQVETDHVRQQAPVPRADLSGERGHVGGRDDRPASAHDLDARH